MDGFNDKLKEKLDRDVSVPERLSRENITDYIEKNRNVKHVTSNNIYENHKKPVWKTIVSAAAVFAVVAASLFGFYSGKNIEKRRLINEAVKRNTNSRISSEDNYDYSEVKKKILNYYSGNFADDNFSRFNLGSEKSGSVAETESLGDSSKTNTRTEGIDEGDVIKTDADNIYFYSQKSNCIIIASTGEKPKIKSKIDLTDGSTEISDVKFYLYNNYLAVFITRYPNNTDTDVMPYMNDSVEFSESVSETSDVILYDITDRSNPKKVSSITSDSGMTVNSSRMNNGVLLICSSYNIPYKTFSDSDGKEEINKKTDYVANNCIPSYNIDSNLHKIAPDDIEISDSNPLYYQVLTLVDITSGKLEVKDEKALLANYAQLYADNDNIYLFYNNDDSDGDKTEVTKYNYGKTTVKKAGSVSVKGYVIDDYSLDEYGGKLRIACSYFDDNTDKTRNKIYVIDSNMNIIGSSDYFGDDENIKSVRFYGNYAYAVTFLQKDPLFVIDLSVPSNPKITGEVKLNGYSGYLHKIDDNHIIGIGPDGDDEGTNENSKIILFDVSDPKNPKAVSSIAVNNAFSQSEFDRHSVTKINDSTFAVIFDVISDNTDSAEGSSSSVSDEDGSRTDIPKNVYSIIVVFSAENGNLKTKTVLYNENENSSEASSGAENDYYADFTKYAFSGNYQYYIGNGNITVFSMESGEKIGSTAY